MVGRIEDIVSLWRISDSGTCPRRKYRRFVHCIYNKFFLLDIFIYYSLEYIYIFHSKAIYLFGISTRCTPIIYVFIFLVNVIVYLLFYHWISILCNNHTSPQNKMKNRIRILYKPGSHSSWSKITFTSMKDDCSLSNVYFDMK